VLYSNYYSNGSSVYPKGTDIALSGKPRRGVNIQYEKVDINPTDLSDADFLIRGKSSKLAGR
jgi:hypothetical protein